YGASPMPAALLERLLSTFPALDVFQGYGMTESSAVLTALGPDEHRAGGARLQSAGLPLPGVVLSIQDAGGKAVAPGETGEVCARAGNFMREYWKQPEATAEAFRGGCDRVRGRDHRPRPGVDRRVQVAEVGRDPDGVVAVVGSDEGVEAGAAGALLGGARSRRELSSDRPEVLGVVHVARRLIPLG